MNENEDQIFSITIQQTSSAYDQDNINIHPPDDYTGSSRSTSTASTNPRRRRKTKLERAKEMLLNGEDLPRSYCTDENLFPALVDSLQSDYNQLVNPKSDRNKSSKPQNYNTTNETNEENYDNGDNNISNENDENASEQPNTSIRKINTTVLKSSEVVYRALKRAQEYYDLFLALKEKERIQQEIKERLKSAKNEKRELMQMINNQEKNMNDIFKDEENKLVKKHDNETQKFNDFWESEKKQRDFNKTSDTLRLLRRQADLLLMDKQYQESLLCQKKADELEASEIENRRSDMAFAYEQSFNKLQAKQRREMKTLRVRQKMKKTEYNAAKNEEITKVNTKIAKIENELAKSNDPFFINRIRKSQQMEVNSVNCFTASKYKNNKTVKNKQSGSNVVSSKRPAPRSYRNIGKMDVSTGDFNQVPLPPLRTDLLIYRAQTARK